MTITGNLVRDISTLEGLDAFLAEIGMQRNGNLLTAVDLEKFSFGIGDPELAEVLSQAAFNLLHGYY